MIGSNAVTRPPGDGRHSALPSGFSTRSTGSRLATTTKEAGSSFHSLGFELMNVVTSYGVSSTLAALCVAAPTRPMGDKTTDGRNWGDLLHCPEVWLRRHRV